MKTNRIRSGAANNTSYAIINFPFVTKIKALSTESLHFLLLMVEILEFILESMIKQNNPAKGD